MSSEFYYNRDLNMLTTGECQLKDSVTKWKHGKDRKIIYKWFINFCGLN